MTTPPPALLACGHKESHTGLNYVCTERGEHSHHVAKDPDGNALLTWPNSPMLPVGSVVVCTEHLGAHVATVAAHVGNKLGVAWGLNCLPENRVHARDAATCDPAKVRICAEEDLPGGDFQRSDLATIRWAAQARGPAGESTPPPPGAAEALRRKQAAAARHQARRTQDDLS